MTATDLLLAFIDHDNDRIEALIGHDGSMTADEMAELRDVCERMSRTLMIREKSRRHRAGAATGPR